MSMMLAGATVAWSLWLSLAALVISASGFMLAVRTYSVSHRPYLGVVEARSQFVRDASNQNTGVSWVIILENGGSIPAHVNRQQIGARVTMGEMVFALPQRTMGGHAERTGLIMPKRTFEYTGRFDGGGNGPTLSQVLDGSARLLWVIVLEYSSPSWLGWRWPSRYTYSTELEFEVRSTGLGWAPVRTTWT